MSEALTLPPLAGAPEKRTPTVYFIDDSATMREVIKIAFRRESINVITCADAAAALAQFEQNPPDAVITDVIMPDQDGYSVCTQIKQHPEFGSIPVILMSGVVNKTVADKAIAVPARLAACLRPLHHRRRPRQFPLRRFTPCRRALRKCGRPNPSGHAPWPKPLPPDRRLLRPHLPISAPRPRVPTSSSCAPKSRASSSSSRNSKPSYKSSANTTKPSKNTSTT